MILTITDSTTSTPENNLEDKVDDFVDSSLPTKSRGAGCRTEGRGMGRPLRGNIC